MYKLAYVKCGRKFGTVEAQLVTESDVKIDSPTTLQTSGLAPLPSYLGNRTMKIMINGFDSEINPMWLLIAVYVNIKEEVTPLELEEESTQNCCKSNNPGHINRY